MIDIHSHLLPNLDDGSSTVGQSVAVLNQFAKSGVTAVVLTPHVSSRELVDDPDDPVERRQVALEGLQAAAPQIPELHLGFEIMLDQLDVGDVLSDPRFSLAGSRYRLVEFPLGVTHQFAVDGLKELVRRNLVPVVAHVERYPVCTPSVATAWRHSGAKLQVNSLSLTGNSVMARKARRLISAGLVDVVAGDNHGDERSLASGVEYLTEQGFPDEAHLLTTENPRAILENGEMTSCPPIPLKASVMEALRGLWK